MSLILDALRKMELERKARRQGSTEIRAEVLNYRGNPPAPKKSLLLPVATGLFIVAAAAGSFFYFKNSSPRKEPPSAAEPATVAAPAPPATTQPPPSMPLAPPQTLQPADVNRRTEASRTAENNAALQKTGDNNLSISGIAWQEERYLRRAVINGTLLSEGEEILGAKIVEIRENLVRFRRGGSTFEVAYPSGSGK